MGKRGRVKIPLEIYEEVTDGNDAVADWLKSNMSALLLDEHVHENIVEGVIEEGYADDLNDAEIEKLGRDPFLIAYALAALGRRFVISNESSRPGRVRANRHVPDVCSDFNVPCGNTFMLIRELDFNTNWNAS